MPSFGNSVMVIPSLLAGTKNIERLLNNTRTVHKIPREWVPMFAQRDDEHRDCNVQSELCIRKPARMPQGGRGVSVASFTSVFLVGPCRGNDAPRPFSIEVYRLRQCVALDVPAFNVNSSSLHVALYVSSTDLKEVANHSFTCNEQDKHI